MGTILTADHVAERLIDAIPDGGGTVQVYPGQADPVGYIVAFPGYTARLVVDEDIADAVEDWLRSVQPILAWQNRAYAGIWVDSDGAVVLDVVEDITERAVAEALGRARGEIAIWDVKRGEEITLLTGVEADARRAADVA